MESVPSYLSYLRIDVNTVVPKLGLSLVLQFTTVTTVGADLRKSIILGSTQAILIIAIQRIRNE